MPHVRLLWVHLSHLTPRGVIKSHSHEYYHLLCVRTGQLQFSLDRKQVLLHSGDMVLVSPHVMHDFRNLSDACTSEYYEIKFTVLSRALVQQLPEEGQIIPDDTFACQLVEHIAHEYMCCMALKDDSAAAALDTLVFHLSAEVRRISPEKPEIMDTTGFTPLARRVITFLTNHFGENINLDDVASGVGISKNYLCNAFKRTTGITILDCLNMIRIRKAAEMIVYSDLTLSQVSQMCGYVSVSHFNRVFARYVGLPPGQCRRAYSSGLISREEPGTLHPDSFMYSVLAGKSISPAVLDHFEASSLPEE